MNRQEAREVSRAMCAAIAPVLDKYGLVLDERHVSTVYADDSITVKIPAITAAKADGQINLATKEAKDFLALYRILGWESIEEATQALGAVVEFRGEKWQFLGYNARAPKFPVLYRRVSDGKVYKHTNTTLRHLPHYKPFMERTSGLTEVSVAEALAEEE